MATYCLWETPSAELVESSVLHLEYRSIPWVICLPSSVGCSMGCQICAISRTPRPKSLSHSELLAILRYSLSIAGSPDQFQATFMGQGEPLCQRESVFAFCSLVCRDFPTATIGISTVGVSNGIRALTEEFWANRVKLQLSVHACPSDKRRMIIPAEKEFPIAEAIHAAAVFSRRRATRCCINYVLLDHVNDSEDDAELLASMASSRYFYVKLAAFNTFPGCVYSASSPDRVAAFGKVLQLRGIETHVFQSVGTMVGAGCGQTRLVTRKISPPIHARVCTGHSTGEKTTTTMTCGGQL